jgi:hypothetical protein
MGFLIMLVITLLVVGIVCGVLVWVVRTAPFVPEPMKAIAVWLIPVVGVLYLLLVLIGAAPPVTLPWYHGYRQ